MKLRVTAAYEHYFDLDGELRSYCDPGDTPDDVLVWLLRDNLISISDITFEAEFVGNQND